MGEVIVTEHEPTISPPAPRSALGLVGFRHLVEVSEFAKGLDLPFRVVIAFDDAEARVTDVEGARRRDAERLRLGDAVGREGRVQLSLIDSACIELGFAVTDEKKCYCRGAANCRRLGGLSISARGDSKAYILLNRYASPPSQRQ